MPRPSKEIDIVRKTVSLPRDTAILWEELAGGAYHRGEFLAEWLPRIKRVMETENAAEAAAAAAASAERERFLAVALAKQTTSPQ